MTSIRHRPRRDARRLHPLIGVGVAAVLAVAVFISYSANNGLPWESAYDISADVPNAQRLAVHADVRIAGVRVGQVRALRAMPPVGGDKPFTRLDLALDREAGRVPVDTRIQVRSASVLGATYV